MSDLSKAAREVQEASEERRLGPKDCARCPDCMALLRGTMEQGRLRLEFIAHADTKETPHDV